MDNERFEYLSDEERKVAIECLNKLLKGEIDNNLVGICWNLKALMKRVNIDYVYAYQIVRDASEDWPQTTGNAAFPVPWTGYYESRWEEEQLTLRHSLIKHIISVLT